MRTTMAVLALACAMGVGAQGLEQKEAEVRELASGARAVSKKIGEVALTGELATNKDALAEMKRLVAELEKFNERLERVEAEIAELRAAGGGKREAGSVAAKPAAEKGFKPTAYFQFQFRDTNEAGSEQHSWMVRRARIGGTYTIDDRSSAKFSFDAATGTSQSGFELKDAILSYKLTTKGPATTLKAGQFPVPLGYETERSSSVREFPERARYNNVIFAGQRLRGAMVERAIGDNVMAYAGMANSLTVKDKEHNPTTGPGGSQSGFFGARFENGTVSAGLGYLVGKRPLFTGGGGTSPEVNRRFLVLDAGAVNMWGTALTARGEVLVGKDRMASTIGAPGNTEKDVTAYHLLLDYRLNTRNEVFARIGTLDFDADTAGNTFREYGVGYRYFVTPSSTITAAWEVNEDPTLVRKRFNVGTVRWQLKF